MKVTATTPEEFALILEPFPFLSDEDKSELVETSRGFFDFLKFMMEKHSTTADVVQARMDMSVNAKLAAKMIKYSEDEFTEENKHKMMEGIMGEVFDEVCKEEGYDGSLKEYAIKLMGIQQAMQEHIKELMEDGREDELKAFVALMEANQ